MKRRPRRRHRAGGRSPGPIQVFISYAGEDLNHGRLQDFLGQLERVGIRYWIDKEQLHPGENILTVLETAIEQCDACVFLLTANSLRKPWCAVELAAFWGAKKRVYILTVAPELDISVVAPQFSTIFRTESTEDIVVDLQRLAAGPGGPQTLGSLTSRELGTLIVRSARQVTRPLEDQITALSGRLTGLLPFDDNSIFGERYEHFYHEKRAIAIRFMECLSQHLEQTAAGHGKIRLILDSGTTLFPVFGLLLDRKHDPAWTSRIEIITNNIPGVLVMLRDGRAQDRNPYSKLAYNVHVVGGDPIPAYWALLPSSPAAEMERLTSEGGPATTIGVTTGNWARANGKGLFVRGHEHASFKTALMQCSSVIYVLLPLGKMIEAELEEVNRTLAGSHHYTTVELPLEKERFLVTTAREPLNKMHSYWTFLKHALTRLAQADASFKVRWVDAKHFSIFSLVERGHFNEEDLEMPHRAHQEVLKTWFDWGSRDPG